MKWLAPVVLAVGLGPSCTCRGSSAQPTAPPPVLPEPDGGPIVASPVVLDVLGDLGKCALGHRGILVDFGDSSALSALHPGSLVRGDDALVEHEGATWLRVRSRALTTAFYWPALGGDGGEGSAYVEARIRGLTARAVAVSLDGKSVATVNLDRAAPRIVVARSSAAPSVSPGAHELTLRFIGGPRAGDEPLAEIDWAHVGAGEPGDAYAAPTRADVVTDATVGGRSLRALSLRAPGFVRCAAWIPADATLETSLATVGGGDADVEARLVRDRRPPTVLGTAHVTGGATSWAPWSVPLTGLEGGGALASIELVVRRAAHGTRVLLGEPRARVVGAAPMPAPPVVRSLVLVVLGTTAASSLAPWGGPHAAPELSRLAAQGTTFAGHRASSSLVSSVFASILTGLPSRLHGVDDPDARLPRGPTTIEEACRQGGIPAAMFTADPTTGAAFGFDRGWDTFVAHDPLEATPATAVFDDAAAWIEAHKAERFLVVVHARGGHPPWDATPDELKTMPPAGYLGIVEPQRAAEVLTKVHKHAGRFKEDDKTRAWALYDHALDAHDAALGRLLGALRAAGREDDTAVVVTGDVGPAEGQPVPFVDVDSLDEQALATPLVVRWPGAVALSGLKVAAPSSPVDLARTTLGALGLVAPEGFQGDDLAALARGAVVPAVRPLVAARSGRFAMRWGPIVLLGVRNRELRLCDLSLDPACASDVRATAPLALEPLHRQALEVFTSRVPAYPREPCALDEHATSALVRWGRAANEREADPER